MSSKRKHDQVAGDHGDHGAEKRAKGTPLTPAWVGGVTAESAKSEIARLEAKIERLEAESRQKIARLEAESRQKIAWSLQNTARLETEILRLEESLSDSETKCNTLTENARKLSRDKEALQKANAAEIASKRKYRKRCDHTKNELSSCQDQLEDAHEEIASLKKETASLKEQIASQKEQIASLQKEAVAQEEVSSTKYASELEGAKTQASNALKALTDRVIEIKKLSTQLSASQAEVAKYTKFVETMRTAEMQKKKMFQTLLGDTPVCLADKDDAAAPFGHVEDVD